MSKSFNLGSEAAVAPVSIFVFGTLQISLEMSNEVVGFPRFVLHTHLRAKSYTLFLELSTVRLKKKIGSQLNLGAKLNIYFALR